MTAYAHFDDEVPLEVPMCVSSFLVSVDDDGLLIGSMKDPAAWKALDFVAGPDAAFAPGRRVLPASHLRIGEDPEAAARRVAAEQLRAAVSDLRLSRVLTYAAPFEARRQPLHWDFCFVYDADLRLAETPPWFSELVRVPPQDLRRAMFARGHGDVLASLGLLGSDR